MRYKFFYFAVALGLTAFPLACGSDDDTAGSTGGTSGSSGKAGTGGKGGSSGKGGSGPGAAGEAGTGDTGNVAGEPGSGGMAGDTSAGGSGGDTGPSAGAGGEGGQGVDPVAAARAVKCTAIANLPAPPDGPQGTKPPMKCKEDPAIYAAVLCDVKGWNATCVKTLDDLLDCVPTADQTLLYCSEYVDTDTLEGHIGIDFAATDKCPTTYDAWSACLANHQ